MKRFLLIAAFLPAFFTAFAQRGPWSVEIGVSPGIYDRSGINRVSEIVDWSSTYTVDGINYQYRPVVLPTFNMSFGYKIPDSVIGVFFNAAWNYAYNNMEGGPSLLVEREHILYLYPEMRLYYMDNGRVRLYAVLGLGARIRNYSETFEGSKITNGDVRLSYVASPFGMSFGEKWYFSCDFGIGTAWSLFKISGGYRF